MPRATKRRRAARKANGTSPTKRRSQAEMDRLRAEIFEVTQRHRPMTVRQVFYQLVSRGAIPKSESAYKSTVCRLLSEMRLQNQLSYGWITDNTRWMRRPRTYSSLQDMLEMTVATYRRTLWQNQGAIVEVWLEKDALSGVLFDVTSKWDVSLMVTQGYPSLTFLHDAAQLYRSEGRPVHIYFFGDYDPSGLNITETTESHLRMFAPQAQIHFTRVAVTQTQIKSWNLPTRPTKATDSRSKGFEGESVELDAIEPDELRAMTERLITQHVDSDLLSRTKVVESVERETLASLLDGFRVRDGGA